MSELEWNFDKQCIFMMKQYNIYWVGIHHSNLQQVR